MQCLILAAGAGSRLTSNGDLKPFFTLASGKSGIVSQDAPPRAEIAIGQVHLR